MSDQDDPARRELFERIVATDTNYQLPRQRSPEELQQDWQYLVSKMQELARGEISKRDPGSLEELRQLESHIEPFLHAVQSAGLYYELLAAFRYVDFYDRDVFRLFSNVTTALAPSGRRDLVKSFMLFMPEGWIQDDHSKMGRDIIFVKRPGGYWLPMGSYPDP
ncbi:hypothetical protein M409DRAFT_20055 [Zasmidium cellare ATCC 36951]|uniref:Uncharacterized protein n=1 Tax=Zasmidium cellare ATCC 36951 TaxID=1080233 RepID=A0A6A6CSG3_ZASCE|nr:uncharacterized protein M409DRAFT_20055 [Zasmidium cellare ATCC 36951]KAF2169643.1 hypothetical protein M409DRAFT_20055 [Zasmidium cellare ATCC 36951]